MKQMSMKYLLAVLSTLFLLFSCSNSPSTSEDPIGSPSKAEPTAQPVDSVTDDKAEGEFETDPEQEASATEGEEEQKDEKADTEGVEQKNVKLIVSDQKTAGQIIVKQVATSRDGWVSIHRSNEEGGIVLPDSIGEARVDSGNSEEIIVDLWEAPYIGEKLWVLLHIDAGERGTYEFPEKDLAVRKNGETMARSFKVLGEEKKDDKKEEESE